MLFVRESFVCLRVWAGRCFGVHSVRSLDGTITRANFLDGGHCCLLTRRLLSLRAFPHRSETCFRGLMTLCPFPHLMHQVPRPNTRFSLHPIWNVHAIAYSSNASGSPPPNAILRLLSLILFAGLVIYCVYTVFPSRPSVIDYPAFLQLLERGEVKGVVFNLHNSVAFAVLHENYPGTSSRVFFPVYKASEEFEEEIRQKEKLWGIPEHDALHIQYVRNQFNPSIFWTSIGWIAILWIVLVSFLGLKLMHGKLPTWFHGRVFPKRSRPDNRKSHADGSDTSDSATWKRNHFDGHFDSSHRIGSNPFFWDPFTGLKTINPVTTDVKFKDVAGMHASKQEVMEFVSYLRDPRKYQALGAKLPKGALLLGPPGTGKTLLVKALSNEACVPFFSMAGSEFVEVIGGLGASRIRQLFRVARSYSPAIIFIDELDSIGRRRTSVDTGNRFGPQGGGGGGASEMEQTLNQLLSEMDGMSTAEGTIVFAATNRVDLLDKALLRAGRFDRHIFIDLPNLEERKELLAMYTAKYLLAPSIVQSSLIQRFAIQTPGMSGADIARLCNEAALAAARRNNFLEGVTLDDFEAAFERVIVGAAKRFNPLSSLERRVAAVQEAGRALIAWLLPHSGLSLVKVSIVPRTTAGGLGDSSGLGFTHLAPEERRLFNTEELSDRMTILLGGRAAEKVIFNAVSDASQRYLRQASCLALKQVREWGMSKSLGNLSFEDASSESDYLIKPYSQRTHAMIELEAQQLVAAAFARCIQLLRANKSRLQRIIDALLQKEVLTHEELDQICLNTPKDVSSNNSET